MCEKNDSKEHLDICPKCKGNMEMVGINDDKRDVWVCQYCGKVKRIVKWKSSSEFIIEKTIFLKKSYYKMGEPSKKAVFKEALKDLKRHLKPSKQMFLMFLIFSVIFSIVFFISMIRIVITNQGILIYLELNIIFSSISGICIILLLVVIDIIRELHFTYHSSRLGKIKQKIREKNKHEKE